MASRFVGAPDLAGYGPSRFRMRMAAASTKASKVLFETISSGTGRDEVGAGYGVDYVSTRRVSSGDFPKLKDWPPLAEKEYDHCPKSGRQTLCSILVPQSMLLEMLRVWTL